MTSSSGHSQQPHGPWLFLEGSREEREEGRERWQGQKVRGGKERQGEGEGEGGKGGRGNGGREGRGA